MLGTARKLLIVASLLVATGRLAYGQTPTPPQAPRPVGGGDPVAVLPAGSPSQSWVRPEFGLPPEPAPAPSFSGGDPQLDQPGAPPPGWYASVEALLVGVHLRNKLLNNVPVGAGTDLVHVAGATLDWTVAPRFEVGYRVPDGFGEFFAGYRFLATEGKQTVISDPVAARMKSRLTMNVWDLAYANRDFPPGPCWEMRWKVGVRLADVFFDAQSDQPGGPDNPAALVEQRTSSNYLGAGPFLGLELARQLNFLGLGLYGQIEGAYLWGHLHQEFQEKLFSGPPDNTVTFGANNGSTTQAVGMVMTQAGICWTPPRYNFVRFFLGYQFEFWSQVGRDDNTGSRGDLYEHGVFFRGELNF
jgi:hypothetical protein